MNTAHGSGEEPKYFVLCFPEDLTVKIAFDRDNAQSTMEAHDVESWVVFDDEGFRRDLTPEQPYGRVLIGRRTGSAPATAALYEHLQRYLSPKHTEGMPLAGLIDLALDKNRLEDNETRRRSWKILGLVLVGIALFIVFKWMR
jgi:hypothetical protein